jgi:ferredoxin
MKVKVDQSVCTGCGVCADACPEVFEMDANNISVVKVETVPAGCEDKVRDAAGQCPVTCIEVTN